MLGWMFGVSAVRRYCLRRRTRNQTINIVCNNRNTINTVVLVWGRAEFHRVRNGEELAQKDQYDS